MLFLITGIMYTHAFTPWNKGAFETRQYRNLFVEMGYDAAASMMCSHEKSREFVDALWNARHEPFDDGYFDADYDGLLRLFAFMHLSGHYQVIFPGQ